MSRSFCQFFYNFDLNVLCRIRRKIFPDAVRGIFSMNLTPPRSRLWLDTRSETFSIN